MMDKIGSVEWWKDFVKRVGFPTDGHFLIVPEEEPGEVLLMHGETQRHIAILLDENETLNECAAMFRKVLPLGQVAAPSGSSDSNDWWMKRLGKKEKA